MLFGVDARRDGDHARVAPRGLGGRVHARLPEKVADSSALHDQVRPGPRPEGHALTDARARLIEERRPARRLSFHPGMALALVGADLVALAAAGLVVRGPLALEAVFAALAVLSRAAARHYRRRLSISNLDDGPRLVGSAVAAVGLSAFVVVIYGGRRPDIVALVELAFWFAAFATMNASPRASSS